MYSINYFKTKFVDFFSGVPVTRTTDCQYLLFQMEIWLVLKQQISFAGYEHQKSQC